MKYFKIIFCLVLIFNSSCKTKRFEDYNKNDFYETQGVIIKTSRTSNSFDSPRMINITYEYLLHMGEPLIGHESNIDLVLNIGDPIVVLVHKKDRNISFFGRFGIIDDNLKFTDEKFPIEN